MPNILDLLPNDLHDRFAHYLFSSAKYPAGHFCDACLTDSIADDNHLRTLLHYARNSPTQCLAVASAMSGRLHITSDWRSQSAVNWISLLANHIRTLDISKAPGFAFPGIPPLLPKLERAAITVQPEPLSLIHGSPNLRHLKVFIYSNYEWDRFVAAVRSLQLRELQLVFIEDNALVSFSRGELMNLPAACPTVEALYLATDYSLTPAAWDMIKGMPSLKRLRVNAPIEEQHVPFVQTLQEIGLIDVRRIEEATRFGPAVTHLSFSRGYKEDIMRIRFLPNLRSLVLRPRKTHERALIGRIDNVEELSLSWEHNSCIHSAQLLGAMSEWHPVYYEPHGKVLEEILRTAKRLKSLHIEKAIVSSDVILRLLKIAGDKLEKFEICHDWQREPVPDRMARILNGIAQFCPNMKTLSFLETSYVDGYDPRLPIFATSQQSDRCLRALEDVVAAVSAFQSYRHVRSTILNRFTEEQGEQMTWQRMLESPCDNEL